MTDPRIDPEEVAEELAEGLRARGIDPTPFTKLAPEVAERMGAERSEEVLDRLARFAREAGASGFSLQSPFAFSILPLSKTFEGQPGLFLKAVDDLASIVTNLGETATRTIQRGVAALCGYADRRAWVAEEAMDLARRLAAADLDPSETLLQGVRSLADAAGDVRPLFTRLLSAVERFIAALDERGVGATYPIQHALGSTIAAWSSDLEALPEALDDLNDLVGALQDAGITPHGVLEYGVAPALDSVSGDARLRPEVFPLAATLSAQGINPTLMLQAGFRGLAALPEERRAAALRWAQTVAADGIDPGWFLGYSAYGASSTSADLTAFEKTLAGIDGLARAIKQHGHQPMLTFEEGLPPIMGRVELDRVLSLATAIALQGSDPGPPLKFGFGTLAYRGEERPRVLEAGLAEAEKLVQAGYSPWRLLEFGVPSAVEVAGTDDAVAEDLLRAIGELVADLHAEGIETNDLLLYGISPLSRACRSDPDLFSTLVALLNRLTADLGRAKISPIRTVGSGLPAVIKATQGDPHRLKEAALFASGLAASGIDPASFLMHAIPSLGFESLADLGDLARAAQGSGLEIDPLGPAAAALSKAGQDARSKALVFARGLAQDGVDPTAALDSCVPSLAQRCDPDDLEGALEILGQSVRRLRERFIEGCSVESRAFRSAIEVTGGAPGALRTALMSAVEVSASLASSSGELLAAFLFEAPETAARLADASEKVFVEVLGTLSSWALEHAAAPGIDPVLRYGLSVGAAFDTCTPETLQQILPRLAKLASLDGAARLCGASLTAAKLGAAGDPERLDRALLELCQIGEADAHEDLIPRVERLVPLVQKLPPAWSSLIVPVCLGVGAGAPTVLDHIYYLIAYLEEDGDLAFVKEIVTQQGLRAPDVLSNLLYAGLRRGQIKSLASERELLQSFIQEVLFADPDYYAAYRKIVTDQALSPMERRARVKALEDDLASMMDCVFEGEVSEVQEQHPIFGQVLTYVFPASRSASRRDYLSLYQRFSDRPGDLDVLAARGPLPPSDIRFKTGGYRVRDGEGIDMSPWQPLARAVRAERRERPAGAAAVSLSALGQALFSAWIAGTLGKEKTRDDLLERLYRRHCAEAPALPDELDDAGALLKYREFLSDTALEIVQDALAAFQATDPERYERQARAKLAPRRSIGKGLLRGVARTCDAHRCGDIDRKTASERLQRQLRGFDLGVEGALEELLQARVEALAQVIEGLPLVLETVTLGEEHRRVLSDLTGTDLAAMGRELFGEGGETGKLEYSPVSGGPELALRMEPTKRRAHAPVGFCEGVCTSTDVALWETPEFLQCVFWGPERRARGGMHLLRVERSADETIERALALPGINPTLELLREVGPEAILDAALNYARALARAWQLDEVWIPTHRAIATNRGPIRQALEERGFDQRRTQSVKFSYSPYAYAFDQVWVLPAGAPK